MLRSPGKVMDVPHAVSDVAVQHTEVGPLPLVGQQLHHLRRVRLRWMDRSSQPIMHAQACSRLLNWFEKKVGTGASSHDAAVPPVPGGGYLCHPWQMTSCGVQLHELASAVLTQVWQRCCLSVADSGVAAPTEEHRGTDRVTSRTTSTVGVRGWARRWGAAPAAQHGWAQAAGPVHARGGTSHKHIMTPSAPLGCCAGSAAGAGRGQRLLPKRGPHHRAGPHEHRVGHAWEMAADQHG